jgi:hypothetical protein
MATLFFGWLYYSSYGLAYNSQGRYFDAENTLVYLQQSFAAFSGLFLLCLMLSLFFAYFGFRK